MILYNKYCYHKFTNLTQHNIGPIPTVVSHSQPSLSPPVLLTSCLSAEIADGWSAAARPSWRPACAVLPECPHSSLPSRALRPSVQSIVKWSSHCSVRTTVDSHPAEAPAPPSPVPRHDSTSAIDPGTPDRGSERPPQPVCKG